MKNEKQDYITNTIDGMYVVDAGAGTGKTYCITNRFVNILNQPSINIENILLLTFTNNAASNMKDKIICEIIKTKPDINLLNTNISTFDSFCNKLLSLFGEDTPSYLGLNLKLSSNFKLMDNIILNNKFFKKTYYSFQKQNYLKYKEIFDVINNNYEDLLKLIFKLQSRGIFPTKNDWFLDGKNKLVGNLDLFIGEFNFLNKNKNNKNKIVQSKFLKKLNSKNHNYYKNIFNLETWKSEKQVDVEDAKQIYYLEDRTLLINFIHDIYIQYIENSVKENKLTFGFLSMFSLILLYYNKEIRNNNSFEYVMIDEFQDTNELQFMLTLLLMKNNNLLVVGDWKQGIYGFRNATINNILEFEEKIKYYKEILNKDEIRIGFKVNVEKKEFDLNFRSSQKILDFSKNSLLVKASKDEELNYTELENNIVQLKANFELNDYSEIKFLRTSSRDNEFNLILDNILKITNNKDDNYKIKDVDINGHIKYRNINYSDVVVLCRDRKFAQDFQKEASKLNIPASYEGGINLFNKECGIVLLAYLKLISNIHNKESWSTILDYNNYPFKFKKSLLSTKLENRVYPIEIINFVYKIKTLKTITKIVNNVFKFNNLKNKYSNKIITIISDLFNNNLMSVSDLVYFIEENIKNNGTYVLENVEYNNSINIQTIHGSKGLEYPVVFISNINKKQFPSSNSDKNIINYNDLTGLRLNKKVCLSNNYYSDYYNPSSDFVNIINKPDYDEERRLYYVAITRAKQYLFLSSYNPSLFYSELLEKTKNSEEYLEQFNLNYTKENKITNSVDIHISKYHKRGLVLSVHDIMNYTNDEKTIGKGIKFGNYIHECAQKIALGIEVDDYKTPEVNNLRKFITNLNANFLTEVDCTIPINDNLIRGNIDLICDFGSNIYQIVDYKTDTSKINHNEYIKQLSVYYHCLKGNYPKANIMCKIYYITQNKIDIIKPLSINKIKELILNV